MSDLVEPDVGPSCGTFITEKHILFYMFIPFAFAFAFLLLFRLENGQSHVRYRYIEWQHFCAKDSPSRDDLCSLFLCRMCFS